jgi:antitoxin VapB
MTKKAKVFMHGGSQAVRLPKEFRFEVAEVDIRKEGDALILEPAKAAGPPSQDELDALWARIDALQADNLFPAREQPDPQERDFGW